MGIIKNTINVALNTGKNFLGIARDLEQLLKDKDVDKAITLFQNRDIDVEKAIKEYCPSMHDVMKRRDKPRKGKEPYRVEKLPRRRQVYINEVELFFLLGNSIKWENMDTSGSDEAFEAYTKFLQDTRFDTTMRQAKRLAGAETESAKLYHIYKDSNGKPAVKVIVLSHSKGYTLRPLFDQYENMVAFGYGYFIKEGDKVIEHFDIQVPSCIYRCKKQKIGWDVDVMPNPSGKINIIYYQQEKACEGVEPRINREEIIDSKTADTNNYFADPKAKISADVIKSLADPDTVGEVIQCQGKDSVFEYVAPPAYSEMKDSEKRDLNTSILFDSFTPDFSFENMKGLGTLSGEALKRAMILGYIKRENRKEIYDIAVDREKNLILAIMANVTHIALREQLLKLDIKHEFAEPFNEDKERIWESIGKLYKDGIISLETAVQLLALVDDSQAEIQRILNNNLNKNQEGNTENQSSQF